MPSVVNGGTVTLKNGSSVTSNRATYAGGGMHIDAGTVTLEAGAIICNNSGSQCDGTLTGAGTRPNPSDDVCPT